MRATMEASPLERCGVRCSLRPSSANMGSASVCKDLIGGVLVVDRKQDGDEAAHDVGVAVGLERQLRYAAVRLHVGCEPDLARAAAHLVGVRSQRLGQGASARPSSIT